MKKYLLLLLVLGTMAAKAQTLAPINPYELYKQYEETTDAWPTTSFDDAIKNHDAELDVPRIESYQIRKYDKDSCLTKTILSYYRGKGFRIDQAMSLVRTYLVNRCTRSCNALRQTNIFIVEDAGCTYGILVFLIPEQGWKIHAVDLAGNSLLKMFNQKLRLGLQIISAT